MPEARRPNIILIVADDLGYADISLHGSDRVQTPNIDRLARGGVRFTNGYANSSICAPTRAALMTGRYAQRSGYGGFTGPMAFQVEVDRGLGVHHVLLPEVLQDAGYATGAIGKWHLGVNEKYHPNRRGFDEFFGFLPGAHDYIRWDDKRNGHIYRNEESTDGERYLTHAFSDEAAAFVERHQKRPFFLYLAYSAVHVPLQVRDEYKQRVADPSDADNIFEARAEDRLTCLAMGIAMDEGIGCVLDKLDELGLSNDTVVVFMSDNGGVSGVSNNQPFRGGKISMFEGGIRVPFFIRYPGKLAAGSSFLPLVSGMDLFPTLATLAGAKVPGSVRFDGVDLMPHLTGKVQVDPHPIHFWALEESAAVRKGNLKVVVTKQKKNMLFDLTADPGEQDDLAEARPEDLELLLTLLNSWQAEMPEQDQFHGAYQAWLAEQVDGQDGDE